MRGTHAIRFTVTAAMFGAVIGVTAWSAVQGPNRFSDTFVVLQTAALLMAASHALVLCWLSASTAYEPRSHRPLGWLREEAATLVVVIMLTMAVLAASIGPIRDAPYSLTVVPVVLCGAAGMAVCAMAYATGRISVLLRARRRERKRRRKVRATSSQF